jgi:2-polyprenyl-6-methoxyphenol hydroxylase-like FAD-dependent oxidoreductase
MTSSSRKTALISGASIAGPALAFWLERYGYEVTVVERSSELRGGGYPIDCRGTAVDAAERMGILPQIQAAHVDTQALNFVNPKGDRFARIRPETITGGVEGRDYELPRGGLSAALWGVTREKVELRSMTVVTPLT